ncbi:TPA: hypothetical protein EYP27_05770, partial [Candidatus Bathyarchaeota archaeon]|nr:hypothetical protein [Candidatus Bathyarchaeota archaeon]
LLSGTGFAYIDAIDTEKAQKKAGYAFNNVDHLYFIKPYKNSINDDNIGSLKIKLRGKKAKLYFWVKPIEAIIINDKIERKIKIVGLPEEIKKIKPLTLYMSSPPFENATMFVKEEKRELEMPVSILHLDNTSPFVFIDVQTAGSLVEVGADIIVTGTVVEEVGGSEEKIREIVKAMKQAARRRRQ